MFHHQNAHVIMFHKDVTDQQMGVLFVFAIKKHIYSKSRSHKY